jgi:hypothetical protein
MKAVLPPRSVLRVRAIANPEIDIHAGDTFRVGYYSKQDGLDCVWLVNHLGEYEQTWDQKSLLDTFKVVELSDETDLFGTDRPKIEAIP